MPEINGIHVTLPMERYQELLDAETAHASLKRGYESLLVNELRLTLKHVYKDFAHGRQPGGQPYLKKRILQLDPTAKI